MLQLVSRIVTQEAFDAGSASLVEIVVETFRGDDGQKSIVKRRKPIPEVRLSTDKANCGRSHCLNHSGSHWANPALPGFSRIE